MAAPAHALDAFARDLSPRTRRAYSADLAEFFAAVGVSPRDPASLRAITPAHVAAFADAIGKRDELGNLTNAATVARKLSAVRSAFRWLRACGAVDANPADFVASPRVSAQSPRQGLTRAEARALVEAAKDDGSVRARRDRAILLVLLFGGLRRSELAGLRIGDLYEERGHVVLHVRGKGSKVRAVPLKAEAVFAVRGYMAAARAGATSEAPLFVPTSNNRGKTTDKPLSTDMLWRLVRRFAKAAGIEKRISTHSLRHSAITLALDGGAKVERVQAFAGHADPKTTIRYFRSADDLDHSAAHAIAF
jgi:integrase/recombinase XerD